MISLRTWLFCISSLWQVLRTIFFSFFQKERYSEFPLKSHEQCLLDVCRSHVHIWMNHCGKWTELCWLDESRSHVSPLELELESVPPHPHRYPRRNLALLARGQKGHVHWVGSQLGFIFWFGQIPPYLYNSSFLIYIGFWNLEPKYVN